MKFPFRLKDIFDGCVIRVISVVVFIVNLTVECHLVASSNSLGDACDWTGSGLTLDATDEISGRGVTPIYLRCSQGHLEWLYPRGALRVLLRLGASGRDFRGCVKVSEGFSGAHIFVEGPRSLLPLFPALQDDASPQLARCFQSRDGQAALYVEAITSRHNIHKEVAAFSYNLQPLPKGKSYYDSQEDCRPCSYDEMIRLYCTSDFVARGIITAVFNNEVLARAEVSVLVTEVYRELQPLFKPHNASTFEYSLLQKEQNEADVFPVVVTNAILDSSSSGGNISENSYMHRYLYGTVYVPIHCGAKRGTGEFIFMGRFVLDDPVLSCAPLLEDWLKARRMAMQEGSAQCSLQT